MAIAKKRKKCFTTHSFSVTIIYYKFFSLLYDGFRDFLLQIGNNTDIASYAINGYLIIKMSHSFFSRDLFIFTFLLRWHRGNSTFRKRKDRKSSCVCYFIFFYFTTTITTKTDLYDLD